jgi:hemolysin D
MSKRKNDAHEFAPLIVEIEERPLNPLGRIILYIVLASLSFALLWFYFGKIDVVVSARGKIVPSGEIKVLQPIETGVISKILVNEGEYVVKDQILMQIDPTITETSLESKKRDLAIIKLEITRFGALTNNTPFIPQEEEFLEDVKKQRSLYIHQRDLLNDTKKQYALKIDQIDSILNTAKSESKRVEGMLEKERNTLKRQETVLDIIAYREYDETLKNIINLEEQLTQANEKIVETAHRLNEIEKEEKLYTTKIVSDWYSELVEKQKTQRELESQINAISFQNRQQQIKAPLNGYIGKLLINTEGGVVTPAEKLLTIIPEDAPLIIKATVLNQDIGFITKEMNASIKVDTFTFQKYGLINATVEHIAHDAIEDEKLGPVYEVKLIPKELTLNIDGKQRSLESGMSVTAEIKVGKRRIIEFFIYPIIRYLDEGMSVR